MIMTHQSHRVINQAISGSDPPKSLSTDNDPLFTSHRWQANLRILKVSEIKSIPYASPVHRTGYWHHPARIP